MIKFTRILKGGFLSAVAGLFAAGVVTIGQVSEADAALMLRLSSGGSTVTLTDDGAGDFNPTAGRIAWIGQIGGFFVNIVGGISKPVIGSASQPRLDLASQFDSNFSSGNSGTLTISLTDTDFTVAGTNLLTASSIGGTTDGSVSVQTFADNSNAAFGTGTALTSLGPLVNGTNGQFGAGGTALATLAAPSSFTLIAATTHGSGSKVTSWDLITQVDEPSTLALLGIGLVGLGLASRRKQRSKAA